MLDHHTLKLAQEFKISPKLVEIRIQSDGYKGLREVIAAQLNQAALHVQHLRGSGRDERVLLEIELYTKMYDRAQQEGLIDRGQPMHREILNVVRNVNSSNMADVGI